MRILVVGDLHGKMPVIREKNFDCMVVVGDVCDDSVLGAFYREFFINERAKGKGWKVKTYVENKVGGKERLEDLWEDSLKVGKEILKYLDSFGKPIFMVAGNWDSSYGKTRLKDRDRNSYSLMKVFYDYYLGDRINPKLVRGLENIQDCMFRCHEFNGINFIGYGLSSAPEKFELSSARKNLSGFSVLQEAKLRMAEKKIRDKLNVGYLKRKNKELPCFFISHNVPYGIKLDVIFKKDSVRRGDHMGSTIARDFCLKFKPEVCVGGHVHEGKGEDRIGKTFVLNPGMGQVLLEFNEIRGKVKKVKFIG
ncbi:MAG: metallophosphoesterase [Candidatus Heimdallarchaeota archaeon]|nr:metallophosphoesterase [Candidatus Heimdallarchaeota archaeon]